MVRTRSNFYLNEDDEQIPGRKLKLVREEAEKPGLSLVSEVLSQPSVLSSDIGGNGDRGPMVEEPLSWATELPIQWRAPKIDLAEPARLRWIENWTRKDLAARFQKTEVAIQYYFQKFKRDDFRIRGLSRVDQKRIREIAST